MEMMGNNSRGAIARYQKCNASAMSYSQKKLQKFTNDQGQNSECQTMGSQQSHTHEQIAVTPKKKIGLPAYCYCNCCCLSW